MVTMTAFSMGSARNCARCGKELTDAASMEVGVGPVCRNLDNALLATLIPANVPGAQSAFKGVTLAGLEPLCVPTMVKVEAAVLAGATADWRETVKRIEWLLSHPMSTATRDHLMGTVKALGYVGLVSLWKGEAATGKASVTFLDGRLYLVGPRNAAGKAALKAIPGRKFHAKGTTTLNNAAWSVPAEQGEALKLAVITHWPNHAGLATALEAAKLAVAFGNPDPGTKEAVQVAAANAKCKIEVSGGKVYITSPYNTDFIAAIKTLPYIARAWDAPSKRWVVAVEHKDWVIKALEQHYPKEKVHVVEA